eukprot:TRINITY_DN9943_c0_g2_i1.p1 TRINITY_DN9943_c0_g2~~TRINITY_DN9943_c0_g2_i1.p1  ORF type:complete len:125 (-),score=13.33 TRINITY_DN9943_c0_g2_i1:389-763(-)
MTVQGFCALKSLDAMNVTKGINKNTIAAQTKKWSKEMDRVLGTGTPQQTEPSLQRTNTQIGRDGAPSFGIQVTNLHHWVRFLGEVTEKIDKVKVSTSCQILRFPLYGLLSVANIGTLPNGTIVT